MNLDKINIHVAVALRRAREAYGYTREQLSLSMKKPVSYQQITKYEQAVNKIPIATLYDMAQALEVDPRDLLPDMDNKDLWLTSQIVKETADILTDEDRLNGKS